MSKATPTLPADLTAQAEELKLPSTPINCGTVHVYLHSGLRKAAGEMLVCAKSLCTASDCDDDTLWKFEEAYRVLANIINRLESDEPAITAAERNQGHVRSE